MKKYSLLWITALFFCISCGRPQPVEFSADRYILEEEETEEIPEGTVQLENALEDSVIVAEEGEELTEDEKLSNFILEKTSIEKLEETENSVLVKITYPNVGEILAELGSEQEPEELLQTLLQWIEQGEVTYVEEEIEVLYDEEDGETVLWNEELMNAMSGGLYGFMNEEDGNE